MFLRRAFATALLPKPDIGETTPARILDHEEIIAEVWRELHRISPAIGRPFSVARDLLRKGDPEFNAWGYW
jgi:hypothetical protein